jgi:hypothetical protein
VVSETKFVAEDDGFEQSVRLSMPSASRTGGCQRAPTELSTALRAVKRQAAVEGSQSDFRPPRAPERPSILRATRFSTEIPYDLGRLLCLTPSKLLSNPPLTARGGDLRRYILSDHRRLHQYALKLVELLVGQLTPIILVFGGGVIAGIMRSGDRNKAFRGRGCRP